MVVIDIEIFLKKKKKRSVNMVMNKNLRENKHRKLPQVNAFSTSRNQSCYINYIRSLLLYNPLGKKFAAK